MFWFDKERSLVKCALNEWSQKDCIRCAVRMFIKKAFSVTCRRKAGFRSVTPLRPVREMVDIALSELSGQFEFDVRGHGTSLDSAGEVVAGIAACRSCIRFAVSACCVSSWTTTCCFAGLLVCRWMIRCGITRLFPRTGTAYWSRILRGGLFDAILAQAEARDLTSDEHFTVDGTLIEAWGIAEECACKRWLG